MQKDHIWLINWLKVCSITPAEYRHYAGRDRLASRINELRNRGFNIITILEKGLNRFGERSRYARYVML